MEKNGSLPEGMYEYESNCLHLMIDEEASLMYSEWLRKPTSKEYREAMRVLAVSLRDKNVKFWVQDTNHLEEVPADDLAVILHDLIPIFATSSLKKLARITSDEKNMAAFMEMATRMKVKLNKAIEIQQFNTYREAAEWFDDGTN